MVGMTWLCNCYVVFIIHFILPIGAFFMHNETFFTWGRLYFVVDSPGMTLKINCPRGFFSVFGIFSIQLWVNDSNKFWRIELCPQISWGDNYHQNPKELVVWNELSQNIIPLWSNINLHPLAKQAITWNNFITTASYCM